MKNNNKVLIKFDANWADEFDVYGFTIVNYEKYQEILKWIQERGKDRINCYFGTNEGWDDETLEQFSRHYSYHVIDPEEAKIVQRLFGNKFGVCPDVFTIVEDYEDEEEYDDE